MIITEASRINQHLKHPRDRHLVQYPRVSQYMYRVSSKTVPTWVFALLSASTHTNCKGWDIFEKFRKFAT